jgi:hypothetical protein
MEPSLLLIVTSLRLSTITRSVTSMITMPTLTTQRLVTTVLLPPILSRPHNLKKSMCWLISMTTECILMAARHSSLKVISMSTAVLLSLLQHHSLTNLALAISDLLLLLQELTPLRSTSDGRVLTWRTIPWVYMLLKGSQSPTPMDRQVTPPTEERMWTPRSLTLTLPSLWQIRRPPTRRTPTQTPTPILTQILQLHPLLPLLPLLLL